MTRTAQKLLTRPEVARPALFAFYPPFFYPPLQFLFSNFSENVWSSTPFLFVWCVLRLGSLLIKGGEGSWSVGTPVQGHRPGSWNFQLSWSSPQGLVQGQSFVPSMTVTLDD